MDPRHRALKTHPPPEDETTFPDCCRTRRATLRSSRNVTIAHLEAAFRHEQIHYAFYEERFCEAEVRRLCRVRGIDDRQPVFERRIDAGGETIRPSDAEILQARADFAETYAFCRKRFGAERIDALWAPRFAGGAPRAAAPAFEADATQT